MTSWIRLSSSGKAAGSSIMVGFVLGCLLPQVRLMWPSAGSVLSRVKGSWQMRCVSFHGKVVLLWMIEMLKCKSACSDPLIAKSSRHTLAFFRPVQSNAGRTLLQVQSQTDQHYSSPLYLHLRIIINCQQHSSRLYMSLVRLAYSSLQ